MEQSSQPTKDSLRRFLMLRRHFMLYDTYKQFSLLDIAVYILLTIILFLDFIARHGHNPSQTVGHRRHHDGFLRRVSLAKNEEYIVFRVKIHTSRKTQLPRFWHGIFSLGFGARPVWHSNKPIGGKCTGRTSEKSRVKTHSTKCTPSLWHNYQTASAEAVAGQMSAPISVLDSQTLKTRPNDWTYDSAIGIGCLFPIERKMRTIFNRSVITHGRYAHDLS